MNRSTINVIMTTLFTLGTPFAWASDVAEADLVNFQPNTPAKSSEVNQNFTVLKDAVNSKQDKVGPKADDNPLHHDRYTDTEAQAAMGATANANPRSHHRYSDNEAVSAAEMAGAMFFGGDGRGGELMVSTATDWRTNSPTNLNYSDVTINSGQTLRVPAGTTIRCSGSFVNHGTLLVDYGAGGQSTRQIQGGGGPSQGQMGIAHPGDAFWPASAGRYHNDMIAKPKSVRGGGGGIGIPRATATSSFHRFRIGGGSGGGSGIGGTGGGLLKVYCKGGITNAGLISANGRFGSQPTGGGGGGIVVLASMTSVDNTSGTIQVMGGNGANSDNNGGSTGGGGGGIVVLTAPSTNSLGGIIDVRGGISPTATGSLLPGYTDVYAGGGGGASGGNGGRGGNVTSGRVNQSGTNGTPGYAVFIQTNPATMMH